MELLLRAATIIDPSSKHHAKKRDVRIKNGAITEIKASIKDVGNAKEIKLPDLHISKGWFDSSVSFGEPGYEERETIANGLETAALSGFSHVALNANVLPVTDSKSHVKFLRSQAENHAVSLHPMGALTVKSEGTDLAELYDMYSHGAVSFYDYKKPISDANVLKLALLYSQKFNGIVQSFPLERSVSRNGIMNEGIVSTMLGLKGIPSFSEELQIARDLYILEYTGGHLHIPTISTKESVKLIKEAKKKGLKVSCSVAVENLLLTDDMLEEFDTRYKLLPPLRTEGDVKALRKAVKDGTIDMITSDHNPIDIELKKTEFDHAAYGSIGLESCFGALNTIFDLETTVKMLTNGSDVFLQQSDSVEEGNTATLSLFTPKEAWTFTKDDIISTSQNASFLHQKMKGRAYGIYSNKKLKLNN
ncbi:dihydroorotase [Luteirhabdus pelagi]|uniref:dihydroorotase n=1 Tax=Luteirhabdus pelagi TaxID=2792783 RepID=UPI00193A3634|nr:dihydroorotase [Luteirhabdus pelagi]